MATKPLISDYLVAPGFYVREALDALNMTQGELAERMGRPDQLVSEIVNAKKEITEETAFDLEAVLGTPAHVWLNLETTYRYGLQARQRAARMAEQITLAANFPYNDLVKVGAVAKTRDQSERVGELCGFFNVAKLDAVATAYAPAFRKDRKKEPCPYALAAWLRMGEREAERMDLPEYDKARTRSCLAELRRVTRGGGDIVEAIREILGSCGIAFVAAPHLPKTYANGATFWHRSRPVVLLSVRGAYEDIFWFTLFHEIGHILLHEKTATFIEGLGTTSQQETEADEFSRDSLIPIEAWTRFVSDQDFSRDSVTSFAATQEVAPAVVVGRLCHEFNAFDQLHHLRSLRRKLEFSEAGE
ncbi:MAG: HigA family addiction module antidote protein [Armatimonadetes bacterium]|nr:HigA family addiction module antidote protein [Armatimonadota bacterium]